MYFTLITKLLTISEPLIGSVVHALGPPRVIDRQYIITDRWTRSWSRCTGSQPADDFLSHPPAVGYHYFFARPAVTFPAEERHRPLTGTKLNCMVTEAHRCEQLAQGCYAAAPGENRTQDLMIANPTLYRYATAPPYGLRAKAIQL